MTWTGLHCRVNWNRADLDAFIAETLAPAMAGHEWYFLRYWETGPHLRVRVRNAQNVDKIQRQLEELIEAQDFAQQQSEPDWLPHGNVREVEYVPETERYGGPQALPIAEEVFCHSTEVAVAVLKATHTDLRDLLDHYTETLKAQGLELIAVDQSDPHTTNTLGLHSAKVIVPGTLPMTFGHLYRRTGLPRLNLQAGHPHPFP